jgi:hypothetical protein
MATAPKGTRKAAGGTSASKRLEKAPLIDKSLRQELDLDKLIIKEFIDYKHQKDSKDQKEHKDYKDHKSEIKEWKDHKLEIKEAKNEKLEIDIKVQKQVPEIFDPLGGTPWKPGDPVPDGFLQQLAMMVGMGTAAHFINPEDRPDLGDGALAGEGNKAKPKS